MIAALYVQTDGVYSGLPGVELWDEARDARTYAGPHPVVAHPPCQRWGKYWFGSPLNPIHRKGDDEGCFSAAITAVRLYGGVLEHPAYSHAWLAHGLPWPPHTGGWQRDVDGGWCCLVNQRAYGHYANKLTWLYAMGTDDLPVLDHAKREQLIPQALIDRIGYKKACRSGVVSLIGGGGNSRVREATPLAFRDLLLAIARTAHQSR